MKLRGSELGVKNDGLCVTWKKCREIRGNNIKKWGENIRREDTWKWGRGAYVCEVVEAEKQRGEPALAEVQ